MMRLLQTRFTNSITSFALFKKKTYNFIFLEKCYWVYKSQQKLMQTTPQIQKIKKKITEIIDDVRELISTKI